MASQMLRLVAVLVMGGAGVRVWPLESTTTGFEVIDTEGSPNEASLVLRESCVIMPAAARAALWLKKLIEAWISKPAEGMVRQLRQLSRHLMPR